MNLPPLLDRIVCLSELSKDVKGELRPVEVEVEKCQQRDCVTLETIHHLDLEISTHDCDSRAGRLLDGRLGAQLVHKYLDGDGNRRGVHEGRFRWRGVDLLATGTMTGVTNVGTHRQPAFDGSQRCKDTGVMEGMLLGTITRARNKRLLGCELRAAYRLRFDPSKEGGSGGVVGVLEGAIVCDCRGPARTCIDFSTMNAGTGPNPRAEQGVTFTVHDFSGAPQANTDITAMGTPFTGLNVGYTTEIQLPVPCSAIEATLVHFSQPASIEAFEGSGASAGSVTMSGGQAAPETLSLNGTSITRVVINAPQDETLLLRFCFEPAG